MASLQDVQRVLNAWKQRDEQIKRLGALLSHDRVPDTLVYGPTTTGKTGIARCAASPPYLLPPLHTWCTMQCTTAASCPHVHAPKHACRAHAAQLALCVRQMQPLREAACSAGHSCSLPCRHAATSAATLAPTCRDLTAHRRGAYVKCSRSTKLRTVLSSIVSQLAGSKRKRSQAYGTATGHASETALCWELQGKPGRAFTGSTLTAKCHENVLCGMVLCWLEGGG